MTPDELLSSALKPARPWERAWGWVRRFWSEQREGAEATHIHFRCQLCDQPTPCTLWWLPVLSRIVVMLMPVLFALSYLRSLGPRRRR